MNVTEDTLYYIAKPDTEAATESYEKRLALMEADLEHAVFNPAASYNTDTYVTKGHSLIRSLVMRGFNLLRDKSMKRVGKLQSNFGRIKEARS